MHVSEKRFYVKIDAGPDAGGNPCVYHNKDFPFEIFMKWNGISITGRRFIRYNIRDTALTSVLAATIICQRKKFKSGTGKIRLSRRKE